LQTGFVHIYKFTIVCVLHVSIPIMQSTLKHQLENSIVIY